MELLDSWMENIFNVSCSNFAIVNQVFKSATSLSYIIIIDTPYAIIFLTLRDMITELLQIPII